MPRVPLRDRGVRLLGVVLTVLLAALQLAVVVPVALILLVRRILYRPAPLPPWARSGPVDARVLLRLAASLKGVSPGTLGAIAVALARAGLAEEGALALARADTLLRRKSAIPRALRWDDGFDPALEARNLSRAHRRFADVLAGRDDHAPRAPEPVALAWLRTTLRPDDPIAVALGESAFGEALDLARALPRDPTRGEPAAAMAAVAMAQHRAGQPAAAASTLAEAVEVGRSFSNLWPIGDDGGYRERALKRMAALQVAVGDAAGGRQTMRRIRDQDSADNAARDAALILARDGRPREALEFLRQIADREQRARACLDVTETLPTPQD